MVFAFVGSVQTSTPCTTAVPESGRSNPTVIASEVVLPAPFGPTSPVREPVGTVRLTRSAAVFPENVFVSPSSRRAGIVSVCMASRWPVPGERRLGPRGTSPGQVAAKNMATCPDCPYLHC